MSARNSLDPGFGLCGRDEERRSVGDTAWTEVGVDADEEGEEEVMKDGNSLTRYG